MEKLSINSLNVKVRDKYILNNVSFTLKQGETLIIIGESGSGKTVLSRLLIGMPPDIAEVDGNIYFDEDDLLKIPEMKWNKYRGEKISYISQNPMAVFNDFQSIKSHAVELFQSRLKLSFGEAVEKMISGMEKLNLPHREELMKKFPFQLSGGMLQRIMFSMMMQLEPELLVADEPTSALDFYNSQKIVEILKKLHSENIALIVITHDYNLARELGGKMIIMNNGSIIEEGKTEELLKNPQSDYGKKLLLRKPFIRYCRKKRGAV